VRRRGKRQKGRGGPAERADNGQGEKISSPSEVAADVGLAAQQTNAYGGKRAGEKEREEQQRDPRQLALER
jgi:hypothetical protein